MTQYPISDMIDTMHDGNRKDSTVIGFDNYTFGIVFAARDNHIYTGFYKNGIQNIFIYILQLKAKPKLDSQKINIV